MSFCRLLAADAQTWGFPIYSAISLGTSVSVSVSLSISLSLCRSILKLGAVTLQCRSWGVSFCRFLAAGAQTWGFPLYSAISLGTSVSVILSLGLSLSLSLSLCRSILKLGAVTLQCMSWGDVTLQTSCSRCSDLGLPILQCTPPGACHFATLCRHALC